MRKTVDIAGVNIDSITMSEAVERVKSFIEEGGVHAIYTPNAEIMMDACKDPYLRNILNQADMLVADGAGVVLASRLLNRPVPEKVSGIDLVKKLFAMNAGRKIRYFLFGSKPGVAEEAGSNILKSYAGVEIAGCRNGYFSDAEEKEILEHINSSGADVLLVALGAPKQEKWIHKNKDKLNVKVCIGVGGSLDVLAGKARLAPEILRRSGFEWLYRLYKEPFRYKRMLKLPKFMLMVLAARLGIRKMPSA